MREGSLEAPTRHPLDWRSEAFYDEGAVEKELGRIFEICHGCRRCVNLCTAFPTLFDLVDASPTLEVDGVAPQELPGRGLRHRRTSESCAIVRLREPHE